MLSKYFDFLQYDVVSATGFAVRVTVDLENKNGLKIHIEGGKCVGSILW